MALPNKMGISFTPAEFTAIKAAAQSVISLIEAKIILNISNEDRQSLSKVGPEREPFVNDSISDFGVNIPAFNPVGWPLADATNDATFYGQMKELRTILSQATERAEEAQMVAGHFAFQFMLGQYAVAKDNVGGNVPGAQTIVDGLKGAFEGMGNFAEPIP
jgi:hypothetical protein